VTAIQVEGPASQPTGTKAFEHAAASIEDWAHALRSLASDLDTALRRATPEAIVIRSLDYAPNRGERVTRTRYQVEGVLLTTARAHTAVAEARSGREIGEICGSRKADVEADAARFFGAEMRESGSAALAALKLLDKS
jgi:hypothetical protein